MSKFLFLISCVLLYISLSGQELVTNGTFTGNTTGWTVVNDWLYENVGAAPQDERVAHTSDTDLISSGGQGDISQTVTIDPVQAHTFKFMVNPTVADASMVVTVTMGSTTVFQFNVIVGTYTLLDTESTFTYNTTALTPNTWNSIEVSIPANHFAAASQEIKFNYANCSNGGAGCGAVNDVLIDEVSLIPAVIQTVPVLSEWGLIVLGLLLITFGTLYLIQPNVRLKNQPTK